MAFQHTSVLLEETIDGLAVKPDGIYVDATLGGGGHAFEVCSRLNGNGRFIGIDQDAAAIEAAGERLKDFGEKVTIIRSNYRELKSVLRSIGVEKVDGIVLDLGVSSYQLDTAERGFSYRADASLDMRIGESPLSWIRQSGDSPIAQMHPWICGWIRDSRQRQKILSTHTVKQSCTG